MTTATRPARRTRRTRAATFVGLALAGIGLTVDIAHAEPPGHSQVIAKDVVSVLPPLEQCPGDGTALTLVYNYQEHWTYSSDTFHLTWTMAGTWQTAAGGSGHFVSNSTQTAPGFPIYIESDNINATGTAPDGTRLNLHIQTHVTINANGEVTSSFDRFC